MTAFYYFQKLKITNGNYRSFLAGLPAISTNVGGVSELIYPNVGLMIDKDLSIESQMDTISKFIIRLDKLEARNKNIKFERTFLQ